VKAQEMGGFQEVQGFHGASALAKVAALAGDWAFSVVVFGW